MCAPYADALERLEKGATDDVLLVSLGEQKLEHRRRVAGGDWALLATCTVSSGKRPPSCREGSLGTPLGLHEVAEKFGDGAPAGTVFVARESTGERYTERPDYGPDQRMLVTTRILRLGGLEPGHNNGGEVDSFARYIYLHGTTHPERFPENLSAGCLTLLDEPLIALYEAVPVGAQVWIQVEPLR